MRPARTLAVLLAWCSLAGCSLVGYGRIQPRHVEGAWTFYGAAGASGACGADSLAIRLRDGDRTWGSFFISGDVVPVGVQGPTLQISHGRVVPGSGSFLLAFSDHASPPERTQSSSLEGTFDELGHATATYTRHRPGPECKATMKGKRRER